MWWLERAIELDNAVMSAVPSHVTIGFHLCRGNQGSRWLAEGSYDPIAPMLFRKIKAHRLLENAARHSVERCGLGAALGRFRFLG